jgi:rhodanese-related sulfurtransferase
MALGMVFSDQIQQIFDIMASTGQIATAVVVAAIGALIALRYWKRTRFLRKLEIPRIGIDELHALIEQGRNPIVIDVRSDAGTQVDARRIPGAISIHLSEIGAKAAELAHDREIVVYCNCPNEVSAARAAATLIQQGLARARPLAGGLDAWSPPGARRSRLPPALRCRRRRSDRAPDAQDGKIASSLTCRGSDRMAACEVPPWQRMTVQT